MSIKQIIIHQEENEDVEECLFLVNPTWIHLSEEEVQDKIEKGEKLFTLKNLSDFWCAENL
jgi:peptide deformylase